MEGVTSGYILGTIAREVKVAALSDTKSTEDLLFTDGILGLEQSEERHVCNRLSHARTVSSINWLDLRVLWWLDIEVLDRTDEFGHVSWNAVGRTSRFWTEGGSGEEQLALDV